MTNPSAPSRSTLLATASSLIAGYNAWTLPAILAPRSPTCTHLIRPTSLGLPPMNNAQYTTYFTPNLALFRNFHVTVQESVVDIDARKVVLQASSTADTDVGPYGNEYVLVVEMGWDGTEVERVVEWVDSGYAMEFFARLRGGGLEREREKKGGEGGGGGGGKL